MIRPDRAPEQYRGPRPAARAMAHLKELATYEDGAKRPYIHPVDGGVSDNLGMRGVLEVLEEIEAAHAIGLPTPLDHVRRVVVVIVNSLSRPRTHWDASEAPPDSFQILLKAAGRFVRASPELKRLPDDAGARVVSNQAGTAPEVSR